MDSINHAVLRDVELWEGAIENLRKLTPGSGPWLEAMDTCMGLLLVNQMVALKASASLSSPGRQE